MEGMEETRSLITSTAPGINVHLLQADLSKLDTIKSVFSQAIQHSYKDKHQQVVLLHNSGTTGDITKPMIELSDPDTVQDYLALNFASMFTLTAHFLSHFKTGHRMVINHTSTLAFHFLRSFSLYSSGKAARNAFMGILAVENPDVRILSYSPGAVDTEIGVRSIVDKSYSEETSEYIRELYEGQKVLSCQESIAKFVKILKEDKFENGANIDYHAYP